MRTKSDKKRQQILRIASRLFLQHGLEAVSMSQIAAKVGGSKATLYNYFRNKEDLFIEVALDIIRRMTGGTSLTLASSLPLFDKLRILCTEYLKFVLSDESIALYRNVLIYPHRGKIGRESYDRAMRTAWGNVADLIEKAMEDGILKKADPWQAALHLRSLIELDLVDRRLFELDNDIETEEIEKNVELGLALFRSYYGP